MKKIFIAFVIVLLLCTGCMTTEVTPTRRVEELLGKYQSMDSAVLSQLDSIIDAEQYMSEEQKEQYRSLMEKQYQNLSYKIENEEIDGETATVDVEIEVLDYATSIAKSKEYYREHPEEFKKTSSSDNTSQSIDSDSEYIDYKIKELKNVSDKVKYDMTFYLTKVDGEWKLDDMSDIDRQKIHGLYES